MEFNVMRLSNQLPYHKQKIIIKKTKQEIIVSLPTRSLDRRKEKKKTT